MRRFLNAVQIILICLLAAAIVCIMLFSAVATMFLNRSEQDAYGYGLLTVSEDVLGGAYLNADDMALVAAPALSAIQAGDVLVCRSYSEEHFGANVICVVDGLKEGGALVTEVTGAQYVIDSGDILATYLLTVPYGNGFYGLLKTTVGYVQFVAVPVLVLFLLTTFYGIQRYRLKKKKLRAQQAVFPKQEQ